MAYIKNTERQNIFKKINKSYGLRKILISIEIAGLIAYLILTFISLYFANKGTNTNWCWFSDNKLTGTGIAFLICGLLLVILGLISLILTFTIRSPKDVTRNVSKLESSALPGRKYDRHSSASSQVKGRIKSTKKKRK